MPDIEADLNATIASAVQARIEGELIKAFASDEVLGRYVTAAMQSEIEVKDPRGYRTKKVPFITHTLTATIQAAVKTAVKQLLDTEFKDTLEDEVRKALRRDVRGIAEALAQSVHTAADKTYGLNVTVDLKMPQRD